LQIFGYDVSVYLLTCKQIHTPTYDPLLNNAVFLLSRVRTLMCKQKYFFNISTHAHTIDTLKITKIHIKTLKNLLLHVSVPFLKTFSWGPWTVLCQFTKMRSVDIRSLYNCAVCALMSLQSVCICVCVWCSLLSVIDPYMYVVCA